MVLTGGRIWVLFWACRALLHCFLPRREQCPATTDFSVVCLSTPFGTEHLGKLSSQ